MPLPSTMTPIATNTLTADSSTVTFSSIPQGYTDLVIITSARCSSTANDIKLQFNGDSASNYSYTYLRGESGGANSSRGTSQGAMFLGYSAMSTDTNIWSPSIININNYANTTTYKTVMSRTNIPSGTSNVAATIGLWRSTSAVTSVTLFPGAFNFVSGSTFTIYGVKAA